MRKFIIERVIPGVGNADALERRGIACRSNEVLAGLGPDIQWVQSYVAADRTFCVYLAREEELIHEHARRSGFPVTRIFEIRHVIDPATANEPVAALA